ncbi:uncharacterized protein LOC113272333 [Papaver somniferum]|uniref:uncharacterized protein LOC113272333 n=1 Tax=Papaver somniferum TaxID=3469 RepID=UPI000E6FF3D0|nr:uncharacterized protein LOC113272333 [Papaver somniferum]
MDSNEDFFKFWEHAVPDDKGFICLHLKILNSEFGNDNDFIEAAMEQPVTVIDETPKKSHKRIAKKPVSKEKSVRRSPEKTVRRSPRLQDQSKFENSNGGVSRKLFVDLLNEMESQGYSCVSQASVVGSSSVPIQVTENFNHDYWVDAVKNTDAVNQIDAVNNNDARVSSDDDEENVVLENTTVDEFHPIEDPNAPPIYDSDEEDDIDYEDIVKTYKLGDESSDSSSGEEDDEEVYNDGGSNDNNDCLEAIDDKHVKAKFDYKNWKEDFNMHSDEEEEPLFPVEEEVAPVDPTKIEYTVYKSDKTRLRVRCRFREEYGCQWFVNASIKRHEPTFIVRKVNLEHTCVGNPKSFNRSANPEFVKEVVHEKLKETAGALIPKPRHIARDFFVTHNIDIPYICEWKARNILLEDLFGNYDDSYKDVPIFCAMVAHTNPGSVPKYSYQKKDKAFMSMTISFAAPMRGFQNAGRPVIGLDACHLTGKSGGVLMAATALDE